MSVPIVPAGPVPTASIKGTADALANAEKVYWTMYFPAMISRRFFGMASEVLSVFCETESEEYVPAQYVFRLANAASKPAAVKKLVTIGKASPPTAVEQLSHCKPQPCKSMKNGTTTQKAYIPALSRSCGRRSPRKAIHLCTVLSENHPPRAVPRRKPVAGAR